jgi:hypothetical protein
LAGWSTDLEQVQPERLLNLTMASRVERGEIQIGPWNRKKRSRAMASVPDALQRLAQQMEFIVEIDKAKSILRTSKHLHGEAL